MKSMVRIIAILGTTATLAMAGEGTETNGGSLLVILFLGFGSLIIVCQLIPGVMLFCSMFKGLFAMSLKRNMPTTVDNASDTPIH